MAKSLDEETLIEDSEDDDDTIDNNEDDDDVEEEEFFEEDDDDDENQVEDLLSIESRIRYERHLLGNLVRRLSTETVTLKVHDVVIKGNKKTNYSLLESEIKALKDATTMQELLAIATIVNSRLQRFDIFDSVRITFDTGPPELPGTTNVMVEVVEPKNPFVGEFGVFSKTEAKTWSLEGSAKLKNLFGYGDIWDGSWAFWWDQTAEIGSGFSLPRFKGINTPLTARVSLLSQDWMKLSSYKDQLLGLSVGLISTMHHDLAYNLTWRSLADPSQSSFKSIRSQLGHSLLSSLKHTYKFDQRDSPVRPTSGYAFQSTSQVCGLAPDSRSSRFLRQECDVRFALPLGFYNAALNFGASAGFIVPWGSGFWNTTPLMSERYFFGGNSSPVCKLGGPATLVGFKTRGLGPSEPQSVAVGKSNDESLYALGGNIAVTAFADLSFDLPLRVLREAGIHGHLFACAGKLSKATVEEFKGFSFQRFGESMRSSAGVGIVVPTKLFRMEVNYCYILKQLEHDRGKTGVQFSFSSPK
ncbi:sorting and assembly machinery component 50 homolog A-like [Papaver somniferum]|uniref:sorting and assembly machinery component 50 homolog A-like n=1 Tax=Papaver somniferum TaxID=3469 RepID=UPI000E6FDC91|nr:sorting and assembly machinery component 50 homolog A-like [Papaver somniferum]